MSEKCSHPRDVLVSNAHSRMELRCGICDDKLAHEDHEGEIHGSEPYQEKLLTLMNPKDDQAA